MIIFTDIDDTLMKTTRKIKSGTSQLKVGALNKNGDPISFMDKKREKLVEQLIGNGNMISIPVTARSKSGFKNLQIKFNHHAVLNFGATILKNDGSLDEVWHEEIKEYSQEYNQKEVFELISEKLLDILKSHDEYEELKYFDPVIDGKAFEIRTIVEDGIHAFMNFRDFYPNPYSNKRKILKEEIKKLISESECEFYMYETGRDLALIPEFISKRKGVEYLLDYHYSKEAKDDVLIGLGDHANDLSFMSLCDFVMFPTDSMLYQCLERGTYV